MDNLQSLTQMLKNMTLDDAFEQVLKKVKTHPQDIRSRDVLFKLYCINGEWDKALLQLQTIDLIDESASRTCELFRNLVFSEMQRVQVLQGERIASILQGEPPEWMMKLHRANTLEQSNETEQSFLLRNEAFGLVEGSAGTGDATGDFSWIADADGRLGPICEFIHAGGYRWIPFAELTAIEISKPESVIDLIWCPAKITSAGQVYHGFMPARYPVEISDEQDIKLGLKTEWVELSDIHLMGRGRKMLITDQDEFSLLDVGGITLGEH